MLKLRDVIISVAGAEFFHMLRHVILPHMVALPLDLKFVMLTPSMNLWAIIINAAITVILLWWASRLS